MPAREIGPAARHLHALGAEQSLLLRLDLDRIRRNLERCSDSPQSDDDVYRFLAVMKVRRHDEQWFLADEEAVTGFRAGEVVERRPKPGANPKA